MAYSSYGSKVEQAKSDLSSLSSSIEAIDFAASWSGTAYDKQNNNLTDVITGLKEQLGYLSNLGQALNLIDQYDNNKDLEVQYQSRINNLSTESTTYQNDVNYLTGKRNEAAQAKNSLKQQIDGLLNGISNRYTETLIDITATSVVNTVDGFMEVQELNASITKNLDMKNSIVTAKSLNESNMYPDFNNRDAWVSKNPYSQVGLYGQCTWFAWGRFYEIYGFSPGFTGNGNQCANQLLRAHGDKFYKSSTPVPGAVFSQGLGEQYGHVGIVLAVDEKNNTITIQDGNYNGSTDSFAVAQKDWGTKTVSLSEFCAKRGGAVFACPKEGVMYNG